MTSLFGDSPPIDPLWEAVRTILNEDWDPLPGSPINEYDSIVDRIIPLLKAGADLSAVTAVLNAFEENLGDTIDLAAQQTTVERLSKLQARST